jgi:SAM-dependent methyltransferase
LSQEADLTQSHQNFVAGQYAPRAADYVTSAVHAAGADLDQVEEAMKGRAGARVLDLGCGGGHVSYRMAPHVGQVVAVDVTADMLAEVRRNAAERGLANIVTEQAAAERLPFADGSFDAVACRFTAHHWADFEAGLREAGRVARPGAPAIFIDVVASPVAVLDSHLQAVELLRDVSHVRDYSVAEWLAALGRAGFAVNGLTRRTLRMDFPVWIARTRTPALHAQAIRALQEAASDQVRRHFAIEADGSFTIESVTFEAVRAYA